MKKGKENKMGKTIEKDIENIEKRGKTAVLYKSKYGASKQYAELLAERLKCEIFNLEGMRGERLAGFEKIILAGGVYAGGIAGINFLKKNRRLLEGKKVFLFAVGASPSDEGAVDELKKRSLQGEMSGYELFYGRGAWDEEKMSLKDRTLCRLLVKAVSKKKSGDYEPWERAILEASGQKCTWVDEKYLQPLIDAAGK